MWHVGVSLSGDHVEHNTHYRNRYSTVLGCYHLQHSTGILPLLLPQETQHAIQFINFFWLS